MKTLDELRRVRERYLRAVPRSTEARLRFTDGVEFNLSGPLRVEERPDGFYVVGAGVLVAVRERAEGDDLILHLRSVWPDR